MSDPFEYENEDFSDFSNPTDLIEELLDKENVCLGIITSKEITSWEPEAEMWMTMTMDKPYKFIQFRVYCFGIQGDIRTRRVDSNALRLVSKGEISIGIEESLNNLAKNNKQQKER